ncbi:MAG: response regulator, partial [Verrucomicrobiales bacterium]|nr:response regulator [Verrucomicrobiales bacterium]
VSHCPDGESALATLANEEFDAVILDFMMPKVDGLQVLKAMRGMDAHAFTPVIIVTTATLNLVEGEAARYGARSCLSKAERRELLADLREIIAERQRIEGRLRRAPVLPMADREPFEAKIVPISLPTDEMPEESTPFTRIFRRLTGAG